MFTGLIEEIGNVNAIQSIAGGKRIVIEASKILHDLKVDDSIAINGVCLTVVKVNSNVFQVEAVGATLEKTTIGNLKLSETVNLERAMRLSDRLGGHFVQGHVNDTGKIKKTIKLGENYTLEVQLPEQLMKYVIPEGSIAIDGISLTVAEIKNAVIKLSIIPHTWKNTTIMTKKPGDKVNVEVDFLARHLENFIKHGRREEETFSENWFKERGF